ncbi:MAG: ATP-binding protein [Thermoanaerobaculales bacterium]
MLTDFEERCEFDIEGLILRLHLKVAGRILAIPPVVEKIMEVVRDTGCAADHEFEVEVALNEALANAVEHGCEHDPDKEIEVCVACDESRGMVIVVRDPGGGFDPGSVPSPVVGENIYSDSGRGIFLINELMDEVHFRRGGTEIWMIKTPKKLE